MATPIRKSLPWQMRLKALMADEALSQSDLAPIFGVSRAAVSHYLSGRTEPSIDQISAVARHVGVSLDYLIHGETFDHTDAPLLSWSMVKSYVNDGLISGPESDVTYVRCAVRSCSRRTFALKVQGDSMDSTGGYRHADVIFVDPDRTSGHGNDVIVELARDRLLLRRLSIQEDGKRYVRALNRNLPMSVEGPIEAAHIYGVVVFSGCFRT